MSDYKVSIIMPVYNAEKFLRDTLDSIVNQSIGLENLEVVIVNDASTDSSGVILDEYAVRDSRFRVIHQSNSGVSAARNAAALASAREGRRPACRAEDDKTLFDGVIQPVSVKIRRV